MNEDSEERIQKIRDNAEVLRELRRALFDAFDRWEQDPTAINEANWKLAADTFQSRFETLVYPAGWRNFQGLRRCSPDSVESAIEFLIADPIFFRSGYIKEWIWGHLSKCSFTEEQRSTIESAALSYLDRWVSREFWYMCRAMVRIARPEFWDQVRLKAQNADSILSAKRASFLLAYSGGQTGGENVRWHVWADRILCRLYDEREAEQVRPLLTDEWRSLHWGRGKSKRVKRELAARQRSHSRLGRADRGQH